MSGLQSPHSARSPRSEHAPPSLGGWSQAHSQSALITPAKDRRARLVLWLVGLAVLVFVSVGAVVGGILGSRLAQQLGETGVNKGTGSVGGGSGAGNGNHDATAPVGNGTGSAPVATQEIMQNSKLAVTGSYSAGAFEIRLTYQGSDNRVRMSSLHSAGGSGWGKPVVMGPIQARPGTPLAMATFIGDTPRFLRIYYADTAGVLRGLGFFGDEAGPARGIADAIQDFITPLHPDSRMSCYWPYLLVQDTNRALRIYTALHFSATSAPGPQAYNNDILRGVALSPGAGLVSLPTASVFKDAGGLVYPDSAGRMTEFVHSNLGVVKPQWSWQQGRLGAQVPVNSSVFPVGPAVGAFTVSRDDVDDLLDVYVVFQDGESPTGDLLFSSMTDASTSWSAPTRSPALASADKGTDIACVTAQAWHDKETRVSTRRDISRCYFQSGRRVREVAFDGEEWRELGLLPIN